MVLCKRGFDWCVLLIFGYALIEFRIYALIDFRICVNTYAYAEFDLLICRICNCDTHTAPYITPIFTSFKTLWMPERHICHSPLQCRNDIYVVRCYNAGNDMCCLYYYNVDISYCHTNTNSTFAKGTLRMGREKMTSNTKK